MPSDPLSVASFVGRTDAEPTAPISGPADPRGTGATEPAADLPERIGPYKIVERLGEGGMGVVLLACQSTPFRRDIALKLLKRGLDTDRIVARFEAERRTLALMDHPNIARVLDAGASEDGRPYVAMELVRGERITIFCDHERLGIRARIELFLDVCHAVRHAHQKGIIHRDLKPSNILVTRLDGRPQPKVIDFGIAKAVDDAAGHTGVDTRAGQVIGTPEYMSPEQAGAVATGVDTRTDVYSLGVLLFELLTGRRPRELRTRGMGDLVQALSHAPPAPSAIVGREPVAAGGVGSPRAEETTGVAVRRATTLPRLRRQLAGDLDTIVLKALAADPERRYQSVEQLASDLVRYLEGQPVEARRPTLAYRAGRFMSRHRVAAGGLALLVVMIGGAAVVLARQRTLLARERDRALEAERRSRQEAQSADQVTDFLVSVFAMRTARESAEGGEAGPTPATQNVTARQLLDRGVERIPRELGDAPLMRARLLDTMGQVFRSLGQSETAEPLLREALALRRRQLDPRDSRIAESLSRLGRVRADRGAVEEALGYYGEARGIVERLHGRASAPYAEVLNNMALVQMDAGRFEQAASMLSEAIEIRRRLPPDKAGPLGPALHNLAAAQYELGRYAEAERLYREASSSLEQQYGGGSPHPSQIMVRAGHGLALRSLKRLPEARTVLERGVGDARRLYRQPHPALATIVNNLALVTQDQGDLDAAESLFREVLAIDRAVSGSDHPDVAYDLHNLGWFLFSRRNRLDEGERMLRDAVAMRRRLLGATHPLTAQSLRVLGDMRLDREAPADAVPLYREAARLQRAGLPRGHHQTTQSLHGLARALLALGRTREAASTAREALADLEAVGAAAGRSVSLRSLLDEIGTVQ